MTRCNRLAATTVVALALVGAGSAAAQTSPQTATLAVTASVADNCVVTTNPVAFGNYNPLAAGTVQATGAVLIRCTRNTVPSVALDAGQNSLAGARRMASGSERLGYELYRPTSNAASAGCPGVGTGTVWNSTPFVLTASPSASTVRTYNVCGEIPPAQDVAAGSYADSVVATVTF